jgi:hypothetical protein
MPILSPFFPFINEAKEEKQEEEQSKAPPATAPEGNAPEETYVETNKFNDSESVHDSLQATPVQSGARLAGDPIANIISVAIMVLLHCPLMVLANTLYWKEVMSFLKNMQGQ